MTQILKSKNPLVEIEIFFTWNLESQVSWRGISLLVFLTTKQTRGESFNF